MALLALVTPAFAEALQAPPEGKYYHGCYPGGISGEEDDISLRDVQAYEQTVNSKVSWVYFSNNWYANRRFPLETAQWIRSHGAVPFIRLMLRSREHQNGKGEKEFSLQAIIDGRFDRDLTEWGRSAAQFKTPLIVEYGTEVNGDWFGWNGKFHGGGKKRGFGHPEKADGPERFVAAYRHIVDVMRAAGALNITWVFHPDATEWPETSWNRVENYYPGDGYVDWIGVSTYGVKSPLDGPEENVPFRKLFDPMYARLVKMAPGKPVMVVEFGCSAGHPQVKAEDWAREALGDLLSNRQPAVRGFSWWNEKWENDDNPKHNTTMRVQDVPALAEVFRELFQQHPGAFADPPASPPPL